MNKNTPLLQANQRWHQSLDEGYQRFLESLTALELTDAGQQWLKFKHSLQTHIEFEQQYIEPLAEDWEDNIHKLVQSDHLILQRLMPRLDSALNAIAQSPQARSELVNKLDGFIKMRNVLVHHDLREMEQLYTVLEQQLDTAKAAALAQAMDSKLFALEGPLSKE